MPRNNQTPAPIMGPIIQCVTLVDRISRPEPSSFQSSSLPGHLLHFMAEGRVRQTSGGRNQRLVPGDVVWYFENEPISGKIEQAPWVFYTVNFEAPTLAPPPEHNRIQHVTLATAAKFEQLLEAWRNEALPHMVRHVRTHALLLDLLLDLLPAVRPEHRADAATKLWWGIEAKLRGKLDQKLDLDTLQKLSGLGRSSIIQACELATHCSPTKRIKELRLAYARGLVQHSELNISEIAYRVGYSRVQELSRDYHERFHSTPREERSRSPIYRRLESPE